MSTPTLASNHQRERRRRRPIVVAVLLIAAALGTEPSVAQDEEPQLPLYVEADAAELDDKQSISIYIGNVEVEHGDMQLFADEVLVHHRPDRRPQKIIAVGSPVRYRQQSEGEPKEILGRALRMEYEVDRDEITLIDDAELTQGEDRFSSDRIVYNRITERVTAGTSAQGRQRVKIRIEPDEE